MTATFPLEQHGVRCPLCDEDIYSNSQHDFVPCRCGATYIDGGFAYQRVGFKEPPAPVSRTLAEWPPHHFRDER